MLLDFLIDAFLEEYFDQRLVGYVALVRHGAQFIQHHAREAQRDRLCGWLQLGQDNLLGDIPIQIVGGVVRCPERAFFILALKGRNLIGFLLHISLLPSHSYRAPK